MASSSESTSYNISTNSKSENEMQSDSTLNSSEIDFDKTFSTIKTSLASILPRQSSNSSLRHFKKLKRKITFHDSESELKNKYSTLPYSIRSLKTKRTLPELINDSNYKTKKHSTKKLNSTNSYYNLNKGSTNAVELSYDSDFPDLKYLQIISKNKEISMSPVSKDQGQLISYTSLTRKKSPKVDNLITTIEHEHVESSTSSNSFDISQINFNSDYLKTKTNNELNLDELLSDCSLSDVLFMRKDGGDRNSPSSAAIGTSHLMKLTPSHSPLESNVSFGISDDTPPKKPSNVIINIPDLGNDKNKNEKNQVEMDEKNSSTVNELEVNQSNIVSNKINLKESESIPKLKSYSLVDSVSSEPSNRRKLTSPTVFETKKNKNQKIKESKHSNLKRKKEKIPGVFGIKKSQDTKKTKKCQSTSIITEDIGLKYDTSEDNYMVELPNGAKVPAFLSTLKPKFVKQLCVCGITKEEIPEYWSESFHDILHIYFYKLCFIGSLPVKDVININHNNLSYKIVMLCVNHYNLENIKNTIKNVDDFVCLEYGIPKINIHQFKHSTYLAVLPNLKIIGYLEVEPIQNAYTLTHDEQFSENIIPAKFGVSKVWVLIKYRDKNVNINLLEVFRKKEKLQKEDIAFCPSGCQSVQFIREYIGNENVKVYI